MALKAALINPLKSGIVDFVVGRLFSPSFNIKSNPNIISLPHFRNELVYSGDYREWTIAGTGTTKGVNGIHLVDAGANEYCEINTNCKPSTKYGILFLIPSKNNTTGGLVLIGGSLTAGDSALSTNLGSNKIVFTTQATITTNKLQVKIASGTVGEYINISNIYLYEIPLQSEIESDFTNLSADALMLKYAPSNFTPGIIKPTLQGRTLKNELDYTASTYGEWNNLGAYVAVDSGCLKITGHTGGQSSRVTTAVKPSTKYGLLVDIVENTTAVNFYTMSLIYSSITISNGVSDIGNKKAVFTTNASITTNAFGFYTDATSGYVKFRNIRLFELPSGSEIESDFTNMDANSLALKYPFYVDQNGKTGGVRSVGQTIENLVSNGDFRYGTIGWNIANGTRIVDNNTLISTGNGSSSIIQNYTNPTNIPCVAGKKYYLKAKMRVTNNVATQIRIDAEGSAGGAQYVTLSTPIQNQWYSLSGIVTLTASEIGYVVINARHYYADASTANGKVMEVQQVMAIDLTARFGAGKEPDLATCDKMFADWFDGQKTVTKVRSVGKNLFDKSKVVQGRINSSTGLIEASAGIVTSEFIKLKPNIVHTRSTTTGSTRYAFYDGNKNLLSYSTSVFTFTMLSNAIYYRFSMGDSEVNSVQLEESPIATPYEPFRSTEAIIPVELKDVGGVADSFDVNEGVLTKRVSNWVSLTGDLAWEFSLDYAGFKRARAPILGGIDDTEYITKYNNATLKHTTLIGGSWDSSDLCRKAGDWIYVSFSDSDTGFTDAMTPTANEIKAYFYGYRMCASDGGTYVSGTKYWKKITDGTGITSTLPTASYAGYTPYKMIYQLANAEVKKYQGKTLKAEKQGTLFVERLDGSAVDVVPNVKIQYEKSA